MVLIEEQKASLIMLIAGELLTSALLLVSGAFTGYVTWVIVVITLVIIVFTGYVFFSKRPVKNEQDERTSLCSLRATRNSHFTAMMVIALWAIMISIGVRLDALLVIFIIWGFSAAAYGVSYVICVEAV